MKKAQVAVIFAVALACIGATTLYFHTNQHNQDVAPSPQSVVSPSEGEAPSATGELTALEEQLTELENFMKILDQSLDMSELIGDWG